jgi:hypothetical protein
MVEEFLSRMRKGVSKVRALPKKLGRGKKEAAIPLPESQLAGSLLLLKIDLSPRKNQFCAKH